MMTSVEEILDQAFPEPEVQSPYVEGTSIQFAWDSTCLEDLKRCPRLYQYRMEGWQPKGENVHLRFGSEFHQAMHDYELLRADGIEFEEAVFLTVKELLFRTDDFRPDHKQKNRLALITAVIRYFDQYKDDKAVTMVLENGKPAVELSFRFELDYGPTPDQPYILCGHLDRVVEFAGQSFVMDYKTNTTTPSDWYWKGFDPHNQMTLYTLASGVVFENPVNGVIINSIQLMVGDVRVTRGTTYRTKDQLEEWLGDLKFWILLAENYARNNYWPMNDTACDKYGGCKFREVCSKSPSVRQKYLEADFTKEEPWNPLKPR
jgi:PD-(D/E)XK nuclease superfamily